MRIALAGNPNSGKTTMYNALTGQNEKVGNWAGVTVEKKENLIKKIYTIGDEALVAVDLPGAYSMSPFTSEESITSVYVKNENPDAIINIVDATNLSRSLFFTTQLLELGIPMVVALNKTDVNEKKKTVIDVNALSEKLGCPVIETSEGLGNLVRAAVENASNEQVAPFVQDESAIVSKEDAEIADRARYAFVNQIVKSVETRKALTKDFNKQDAFDRVITNPVIGLGIFAVVMFLVFQISQAWVGPWLADGYEFENGVTIPGLVTLIDMFKEWIAGLLQAGNAHPFVSALLTEGIIAGVSAVVGFLPLVMVMYFLIALLEDCGYMARATVVLDPIFKKVGLSGKSVIPFIVGTGCAIPGVMAARTIRDERERNAAAMLTPFMPCGAKLPVIALFAGAFFGNASWVGTLMYFVGIAIILVGALLVNKIAGYKRKSFFIMELPEYKIPSFKRASFSMLSRGWSYVVKAGTVILLCNAIVYIMQSFDWKLQLVEEGMAHTSILASIASPVAVLLIPIGVCAWQMAAASITGFIAKENVVGTLAVCFGISNLIDTESLEMMEGAGADIALIFGGGEIPLTAVAALAYLMFNLFTPPCFAAIGAMNAEIRDKKWFWGGIGLQFATGYSIAFAVYQIGTVITTGNVGTGFVPGIIAVAVIVSILAVLCIRSDVVAKKKNCNK